ncbi:MAG: AraC family transcriptional regulator [Pseudomonadota bacterium]|nr:AraC family transcriptional regulator [Pseudomonadota bacterium]
MTRSARRTPNDADSLPIGTLSVVAQVLRQHGHDADALLRRHGLGPRHLVDPLASSPVRLHGRVVRDAIAASGLEHLPLLLGAQAQLDNVGPVRALALNSATARDALDSLLRYARIWYRGIDVALEQDQGYAVLAYSTVSGFTGSEALLTAFLAGGTRNLAQLLGAEWRPALVRIADRRPVDVAPYASFFRAPVLFDQPRHELLFAATDLDRRQGHSDPQLAAFLEKQLEALESGQPSGFAQRVQRVIEGGLLRGHCDNESIAAQFGMHRHTLYRRLQAEGQSYEQLLAQSRKRQATRMLLATDMPISEVAAMLGYGAQGNFTRAFVKWFGAAPSQWRADARMRKRSAGRPT